MSLRNMLGLMLLPFAGTACTPASAQVDQAQLVDNRFIARFSQGGIAQSFQQAHDTITGASFELQPGAGTSGDVTVALYDALPNNGGVFLASGTAVSASAGSFATVAFGPVSVTPDTTYYLILTSTNGDLGLAGASSNPYARGQAYANTGFSPFPTFDYAFQTFYNPAAVPEPSASAFVLVAGGGAALFLCRGRGRRILVDKKGDR